MHATLFERLLELVQDFIGLPEKVRSLSVMHEACADYTLTGHNTESYCASGLQLDDWSSHSRASNCLGEQGADKLQCVE